jgi:hypothetical protein
MRGACSMTSEDMSDVLIISQPGIIHEWILDSRSCFHIFSLREMFDEGSLHLANATIHLADRKEYVVSKVGTVTLDMHNGIYYTLMGVSYIMGLKNNLIFMRSLELPSSGLSLHGGLIRVTYKGHVIVKSI